MGQASGERWGRTTGGSPCHPGPAAPLVCGAVVGAPGGARQRQGRGLGRGTSLACGAQSLSPTLQLAVSLRGVLFVEAAAGRCGGRRPRGLRSECGPAAVRTLLSAFS